MTSTNAAIVVCELSGPYLVDYSPRVPRLTRWQMILAYLAVLNR